MRVNFTDPASIAAWLRVYPERHLRLLDEFVRLKLKPAFEEAMAEAAKIVKGEA